MMQMLEWIRKTLPMDLDTPRMIEEKIESLLKVEKEQIMDAYERGRQDYYSKDHRIYGEQFYNETYGNDK